MARTSSVESGPSRGLADIIGIALVSLALLLLVALISYDPRDVSATGTATNATIRNWIGPVGAWAGWLCFFGFGASAYLLPVLIACFGLSYLLQAMDYFHQRWLWAGLLLTCGAGWLDLTNGARLLTIFSQNVGAPGAGGYLGLMLNRLLFGHFGSVGATIDNLPADELEALQRVAADLLRLSPADLSAGVEAGALQEICRDPETRRKAGFSKRCTKPLVTSTRRASSTSAGWISTPRFA